MALKRVPPKATNPTIFGRLTLSDQDVRDIYSALDELTVTSGLKDDAVSIRVNDYEAENVEDVLNFEAPVRVLAMTAATVAVHVYISTQGAALHSYSEGKHSKQTADVTAKVEYILRQAEAPPVKPLRLAFKIWLLLMSTTSLLSVGALWLTASWLTNTESLLLGISITILMNIVLGITVVRRQGRGPESLLRSQIARPEPFYRRYMPELMLAFTILPTIVAIAIALVD